MARVFSWLDMINPHLHSLVGFRPWIEESSFLFFLIHYYHPVRLVLRMGKIKPCIVSHRRQR